MDCIIKMPLLPSSPISIASSDTEDMVDVDNLIKYVNDFIDNQEDYYYSIKSYCIGNNVELYIQYNDSVVSAGYLDIDNKVHEFMRNTERVYKIHENIWKWVNDYNGEVVIGKKLIDSIYIGDNYVSLWRVLDDAYEEDNLENVEPLTTHNNMSIIVLLGIWLVFSLLLLLVIFLGLMKYI